MDSLEMLKMIQDKYYESLEKMLLDLAEHNLEGGKVTCNFPFGKVTIEI